jgi:hypothetical protein
LKYEILTRVLLKIPFPLESGAVFLGTKFPTFQRIVVSYFSNELPDKAGESSKKTHIFELTLLEIGSKQLC